MSLSPLLGAPAVIQVHAFAALAALILSAHQLLRPKGTLAHRTFGYAWVTLMMAVAISSFWIYEIKQFGDFSLIHILSIVTLYLVPAAVLAAHRHQADRHRRIMLSLIAFALVGAGAFTLLPGRTMHDVVFG